MSWYIEEDVLSLLIGGLDSPLWIVEDLELEDTDLDKNYLQTQLIERALEQGVLEQSENGELCIIDPLGSLINQAKEAKRLVELIITNDSQNDFLVTHYFYVNGDAVIRADKQPTYIHLFSDSLTNVSEYIFDLISVNNQDLEQSYIPISDTFLADVLQNASIEDNVEDEFVRLFNSGDKYWFTVYEDGRINYSTLLILTADTTWIMIERGEQFYMQLSSPDDLIDVIKLCLYEDQQNV